MVKDMWLTLLRSYPRLASQAEGRRSDRDLVSARIVKSRSSCQSGTVLVRPLNSSSACNKAACMAERRFWGGLNGVDSKPATNVFGHHLAIIQTTSDVEFSYRWCGPDCAKRRKRLTRNSAADGQASKQKERRRVGIAAVKHTLTWTLNHLPIHSSVESQTVLLAASHVLSVLSVLSVRV